MVMPRIGSTDLGTIERTPNSPAALTRGLWEVLSHSVAAKATVQSCNHETGEYRIVLHGMLDLEDAKFENT